MVNYRFWFLASSTILIFMGAMLKLEHYANYAPTMIAGIVNATVFIGLTIAKEKRKILLHR